MKFKLLVLCGIVLLGFVTSYLHADELEMQNGDRYFGDIVSVSVSTVVMKSEILGRITVPRGKVSRLEFGTNAVAPKTAVNTAKTELPTSKTGTSYSLSTANTNINLAATFRSLGANTNFIQEIRNQMLSGSPEATSKYDQMVNDLINGKLNMKDLRRKAQLSADQIRDLKRELGSDVGDSLDGYLEVLDQFLKETNSGTAANTSDPNIQAGKR